MTPLAVSLGIVLIAAKLMVLAGRNLAHSIWAPPAFVWQDLAIVIVFFACERIARRRWVMVLPYTILVSLAAINIPVERALGSPLTVPMLRATAGALADSLWHYATLTNITSVALLVAAGIALPFVRFSVSSRLARAALACAALVTILGGIGASRIDTAGLERNPVVALAQTSRARVTARAALTDWRRSPFDSAPAGSSLERLRGTGAGRNVLLVVLESTAAQYIGAFGASPDPTPRLTALAGESLVFDNAYAAYPESIKGLIALLASRYPAFDVPAERHASYMQSSLATVLSDCGYATALFHSGRFMYLGMQEVLRQSGFSVMEDAGDIGGNHESSFGIDELSTVRRVLTWIDGVPHNTPFFATYLPVAGHHPYASSGRGPFPDSTDFGRYRNALHEGDVALGALLDGVRARGLDQSTLVVIVGDHGEAFGQHDGNFGHTLSIDEENVHVPLIVSAPFAHAPPQHVPRVASVIDIAPTVLGVLGKNIPSTFDGISLLPAGSRIALFFTDYSLGLLGLRDGCMSYIRELESGRSRMFDVCADPAQQRDIVPEHADRAAWYRNRVDAWAAAQVARIPPR